VRAIVVVCDQTVASTPSSSMVEIPFDPPIGRELRYRFIRDVPRGE
jgi:hypothetical protein